MLRIIQFSSRFGTNLKLRITLNRLRNLLALNETKKDGQHERTHFRFINLVGFGCWAFINCSVGSVVMEVKETRIYRIPAQNSVDPIDLFVTWYGENKSQIVIRCWDKAWTAYWGGHWVEQVERFLLMDNIDYLVTSLSRTRSHQERNWLKNIIKSIQEYLKAQGFEVAA